MPTISTLTVDINTNTSKLSKGLKLAGTAILGVGVIATKMALDYDDAFTKISAVSNASAADIEKWKGQVLDLAGKTAQAPKELADALFFLASAGLKTSQIMPVLEASAKASAAGLGETADVAKLTANVLNAYAGSGIKAAHVTDILVAAVREGSADTDEFGTAIGRILPIASTAGIGFDSVAASLASLSNVGLDVNEGVTAMRGLFQAMVSPTGDAAKALESVGLSSQDLLDSLQQDGLIATIRMLDAAAKKNTNTQADYMGVLRTLVPNVRALTGMLGLTSQEAERVDSIVHAVNKSTGSLDEAFKTTAESAGFKFRQALAELQVAAIQLGNLIIPVLVQIIDWLQMLAHWFEELPSGMKKFITSAAAVVVAVLLAIKAFSALSAVLSINPYVIIIAATIALVILIVKNWETIKDFLLKVWDSIVEAAKFFWDHIAIFIIGPMKLVIDFLIDHWRGFRTAFLAIWDAIRDAIGPIVGAIVNTIKGIIDVLMDVIHAVQTAIGWLSKLGGAATHVGDVGPKGMVGGSGLQHGGIVTSPQFHLIGEAGPEAVIPLDKLSGLGGGGITVNVYGDVTGDEVVKKVRDGLLRLQARNATTGL